MPQKARASRRAAQRRKALESEFASMAFTDKPWDGDASRYADAAAYCAACLIDENTPGQPKVEAKCHLPVKEPNGDYNRNGIRNALSRIGQLKGVSASSIKKAASRLAALKKQAGIGQ